MHSFAGSDVVAAHQSQRLLEAAAARTSTLARAAQRERRARKRTAAGSGDGAAGWCFRVLEPSDIGRLRALFDRLSPRSRHLRYLAPVRSQSESMLRRLADIDHEWHEALGAFDEGALVGVAHYFRDRADRVRAEISVEVADSHQRRGIGPRLLHELALLARGRGITEFNATALRENSGVLSLIHRLDWPSVVRPDGPELAIALTLPTGAMAPRTAAAMCS
jgi:GNAT superfamily N-acetyltransferase